MAMPAAAMGGTPEQAAILVLQDEVAQLRQAIQAGATAHDALRAAHDALNNAAQVALAQKDAKIQETEERLRGLIFRQQFDLLDSKEMKPDHFRGRATDTFKPWQRKFKAFCNARRTGFRRGRAAAAGSDRAPGVDGLGRGGGRVAEAPRPPAAGARGERLTADRQAGAGG